MNPYLRFLSGVGLLSLSLGLPLWQTQKIAPQPVSPQIELASEPSSEASVSDVKEAPSNPPSESVDPPQTSEDVLINDIQNHWGEKEIQSLANAGRLHLYLNGTFQPDELLTREALIQLTLTALQYPEQKEAIAYAKNLGIIDDEATWTLNKNAPVSRGETLKVILNASALDIQDLGANPQNFPDVDPIKDWFAPYSAYAFEKGLMKGDAKGKFSGNNPSTRGEAAVLLYNVLKQNDPKLFNSSPSL